MSARKDQTASEDSLATRASLLGRLKNWDDAGSWQEFSQTYSRLIRAVAMKAGLSEAVFVPRQAAAWRAAAVVTGSDGAEAGRAETGWTSDPGAAEFQSLVPNRAAMEELVRRCALLHLQHIATSGDPFELGAARPLDFGHWSAHKLEGMTGYAVAHGEAVAIGLALDAGYARRMGWLTDDEADALLRGLSESGYTLWHPALNRRLGDGRLEILGGLDDFREHLGGELCVTMPRGIGAKFEVHEMDPALVEASLRDLEQFQSGLSPAAR